MKRTGPILIMLGLLVLINGRAAGQSCTYPEWCTPGDAGLTPDGKLSRNFYRTPYDGGISFTISDAGNYLNHGGSMDSRGAPSQPVLVAMADGIVCSFNDSREDCGCHSAYGSCGNCITIVHANGEMSRYLHLRAGSCTAAGMYVGLQVFAGQMVGIEGDIGRTCGSDRAPRAGTCLTTVPSGATDCGRHNHWNVIRISTGESLMPMTCEINGSVYTGNNFVGSGSCSTTPCVNTVTLTAQTLSGIGVWRVWQADITVTATAVQVQNSASVVMHAGNNVRLLPGCHVRPGGYLRAEIGVCNTTAPTP